jgi:holo-[acyl-carrier protein] synthase
MITGTGVDIISIKKFRQAAGKKLINRVFTLQEIKYCNNKMNKFQHLAARFACKEAISKALKMSWQKGLNWKEIEILKDKNGKPAAKLIGSAKKAAHALKIEDIQISLSHCPEYAVGMAVVLKGDNNGAYRTAKRD